MMKEFRKVTHKVRNAKRIIASIGYHAYTFSETDNGNWYTCDNGYIYRPVEMIIKLGELRKKGYTFWI